MTGGSPVSPAVPGRAESVTVLAGKKAASCPSAQPDMEQARVFGLLGGTRDAPRVDYLSREVDFDPESVELPAGVGPTQVFRFTARCEESRCAHFNGSRCTLAERIRESLDPVVESLPPCTVRSSCRWYAEQGTDICLRCPQIVTLNVGSSNDTLREAATPPDP